MRRFIVSLAVGINLCTSASAFSLDVRETHAYFRNSAHARSHIPFLDGHDPVHEKLTDKALECGKAETLCDKLAAIGIEAKDITEGVRSNDFPAQYLNQNAAPWCMRRVLRLQNDGDVACILGSFLYGATNRRKFKDRQWAYSRPFGVRGHFGDLQFFHAMAPKGQKAQETYEAIAMWMEFAYRVSRDEFDPMSYADAVPIKGMNKYFLRGSRRIGDLFNYRFKRAQVRGIALGQMLHIAQDSFAGCHVERNPDGGIERFLSYELQNSSRHAKYDSDPDKVEPALSGALNPVAFGKELLSLRVENRPWEKVEPLIRRYFWPLSPDAEAGQGSHCEKPKRSASPAGGPRAL